MKYAFVIAALAVLSFGANARADDGNVSKSQLSQLGLPGIDVMSDAQGSEIRGQGFAFAASISGSGVPGAFNISPAVGLGRREAVAISRSSSEIEASGIFGGIGGGGGFLGFFSFEAEVSSSGFAYAAAR